MSAGALDAPSVTRRKPVLLDANLLLLLVMGSIDRAAVASFKRLSAFAPEDFELLVEILRRSGPMVTTPNVLTEVSNLAGNLSGPIRERFFARLAAQIERLDEHYVTSADASRHPEFRRLGITDVGIARFAEDRGEGGVVVLTVDLPLAVLLQRSGVEAHNFNHLRRWRR